MTKSIRMGVVIATAAVATLALSSCGFSDSSGGGGDSKSIDLLVPSYSDGTQALWEDVIAGFEEENPDISVNLEVQSWDNLNDVVTTKVQGGKAPDIMNGGPFAGFAADDLLYPVSEVTSDETRADFQESFVESASVGDTQYGLPLIASSRTLFVNNDLLEQAGVEAPTTWDELLAAGKAINALGLPSTYGYGLPLGSEEAQAESAIWFLGGGGTFGDAEKIAIDTPENLEAATFMQKMVDENATQPDAGATDRTPLIDVFIQGNIGMIEGLPPTVGQIEEKNPDLDYSMVPIPTKDGQPFTLGVADHLMAFTNDGDKQDSITKFFDYFYTPEVYVNWVTTEGFLPTTVSGGEQLADDPKLKVFLDALPSAQFYPNTNPNWSATDAAFKSLVGQLAQGKDPQAVLTEIQAKSDEG
ncbi:extracellular solute-binding protein [Conyzicola nivalis]|uniref:Solute-binding protein n=1 Tax=Conyzicola nivalis TaxID=1477021 RepID=A0A916WLV4_9MICO|nr:extracellular solute-binding protein [Conyzicola nivalis]GGB12605.1 solute-binding protein [Conyzicola nivalis]